MCESEFDLGSYKEYIYIERESIVCRKRPQWKNQLPQFPYRHPQQQRVRSTVCHSFIHPLRVLLESSPPSLGWYRKRYSRNVREEEEFVFLLFCRHSADSRRVRENRRNGIKRSLGLSINSFSGSVGSRRIVNKKRQLAKGEREKESKKALSHGPWFSYVLVSSL